MLKRRDAPYVPGRPKGLWWKWKRDPLIVDAVLMYAQRGHGKRSSFYSDYTFGVWTKRRERRRAGAGRQGLFRLHRRGAAADRPLRAPQHRRPLRPGARGRRTSRARAWCSRSPSRACSARPGTSPASPCAFPASAGCAGTSRRARPTGSRRWKRCWRRSKAGAAFLRYLQRLRRKPGKRRHPTVIPGRREAASPESRAKAILSVVALDSGFACHSASKTRVNALSARAPE